MLPDGGFAGPGFAEVEHQVYEAAIVPELWPRTLAKISAFGDAAATALVCHNERGLHMVNDARFDSTARRFVDERWGERNTRATSVFAKGRLVFRAFSPRRIILNQARSRQTPLPMNCFAPKASAGLPVSACSFRTAIRW